VVVQRRLRGTAKRDGSDNARHVFLEEAGRGEIFDAPDREWSARTCGRRVPRACVVDDVVPVRLISGKTIRSAFETSTIRAVFTLAPPGT
jgi:hypothetical protein